MPPKAKSADAAASEVPSHTLEELISTVKTLTTSTEAIRQQLTTSNNTIKDLSNRLGAIEAILKTTQEENRTLKEELAGSYDESKMLKTRLNNLEQHHRSWSIRAVGITIPAADETDNNKVKNHLYEKLLKPILAGAVEQKLLPSIPAADDILERAHILPSKKDGPKPIIARFYCREIRALIFRLKKQYAPRSTSNEARSRGATPATSTPGRLLYQIFDDLTKTNFIKMKTIGDDTRVEQCWAANGQLKFKLVGSQQIKRVISVFDSIDHIISNSPTQ
jgi:hypothetical protein